MISKNITAMTQVLVGNKGLPAKTNRLGDLSLYTFNV